MSEKTKEIMSLAEITGLTVWSEREDGEILHKVLDDTDTTLYASQEMREIGIYLAGYLAGTQA